MKHIIFATEAVPCADLNKLDHSFDKSDESAVLISTNAAYSLAEAILKKKFIITIVTPTGYKTFAVEQNPVTAKIIDEFESSN